MAVDQYIVDFWTPYRGKTVQEVECPKCGLTDVPVSQDDRVRGTTYEVVCPNLLCGTTIEWKDEGDD